MMTSCKLLGHNFKEKKEIIENKEPTFVIKTLVTLTCKRCNLVEEKTEFKYEMFKKK